jgi:hypothetical protein
MLIETGTLCTKMYKEDPGITGIGVSEDFVVLQLFS